MFMFTNFVYLFSDTFARTRGCSRSFFGLDPWYYYLQADPATCEIARSAANKTFNFLPVNGGSDLLLVGLVIVDDLLRIAGLIAVGYVIYGGILYMTSQGTPDQTAKAQDTIKNALVGLVIAILATATVKFFGSRLG